MAKCPVCNTRKGKRQCLVTNGLICSLCCGETRQQAACIECSHYKLPSVTRRYNNIPSYTLQEMNRNFELQNNSNAIESALCAFDDMNNKQLTDKTAIRILELLLDKYHFQDDKIVADDELSLQGYQQVAEVITQDLSNISNESLTKTLAIIYFVAKRRSQGKRTYLDFIHQYVGSRVAPGMRILPNFLKS